MKRLLLILFLLSVLATACNDNTSQHRRIDSWQRVETEGWLQ